MIRQASLFAMAALTVIQPQIPHAATIDADGVSCTLTNAMIAANSDTATGGCPAGSGADVIALGYDPVLTTVHQMEPVFGAVGLPAVISPITIEGNGRTILRDAGAPLFRFFAVNAGFSGASGAALTLRNLTLSGGDVDEDGVDYTFVGTESVIGGAIASLRAPVVIEHCRLTGNTADTGGALGAIGGRIDVFNSELSGNTAEQNGGAVFSQFAEVVLRRARLADNVAGRAGGAAAGSLAPTGGYNFDIVDSAFLRNTARSGGALALMGSNTQGRAVNTLFQENVVSEPGLSTQIVFAPGGGAVSVFNASDLELRNCQVLANQVGTGVFAGGGGATVEGSGAAISLIDSQVVDNAANSGVLGDGGGVRVGPGGRLDARGSTIARNAASGDGGGVDANQGGVRVVASLIAENDAGADGGGVRVFQQDADIIASRILDNRARFEGGGVQFSDGTSFARTLSVRDSTIAGNRFRDDLGTNSLAGAGLHIVSFVDAVIERSTISGNRGQGSIGLASAGTAIFANSSANVDVRNSTIVGNDGRDAGGGAIFSSNASTVDIAYSTIVGNQQRLGGGIRNLNGVSIEATILADNTATADDFDNCAEFSAPDDGGGNLADDASCGGGVAVVTDADLTLQPLADNGGATETVALGEGSIAIDAGSDCAGVGDVDQRGAPRDAYCDAGAYEAALTLPVIGFETESLEIYEGRDDGFEVTIVLDKSLSNLSSGIVEVWPILRGSAAPGWDYRDADVPLPVLFDLSDPGATLERTLRFTLIDDAEEEGPETLTVDFVFAGPATAGVARTQVVNIIDDDTVLPSQCAILQAELQAQIGDEDPRRYRNHGRYVSPVARATSRAVEHGEITPECQGCIVSQFARSIPIADQAICEGSFTLIAN